MLILEMSGSRLAGLRFCGLGGDSYRVYRRARSPASQCYVMAPFVRRVGSSCDNGWCMRNKMCIYGRKVCVGSDVIAQVVLMGKKQREMCPLNPVNVISHSSEGYKESEQVLTFERMDCFSSAGWVRVTLCWFGAKVFLFREEIAILKWLKRAG